MITKSGIESRPTYLSLKEHIEAHFLTCFIALLLVRILELETGHRHSAEKLIDSMRLACGTHLEENWYRFDYRDDVLDDLSKVAGVDFTRMNLRAGEIRKMVAATKKG